MDLDIYKQSWILCPFDGALRNNKGYQSLNGTCFESTQGLQLNCKNTTLWQGVGSQGEI